MKSESKTAATLKPLDLLLSSTSDVPDAETAEEVEVLLDEYGNDDDDEETEEDEPAASDEVTAD